MKPYPYTSRHNHRLPLSSFDLLEYCRGRIIGRLLALTYASAASGESSSVRMTLPIDMKKLVMCQQCMSQVPLAYTLMAGTYPNVETEPIIYCANVIRGPLGPAQYLIMVKAPREFSHQA